MGDWPRVTADLPGCGGALKSAPEDFEVTELPAYEPSGAGDHLFLWVEKVGVDTAAVARFLARSLAVPEAEVGYAGLKDRQARCFQYFSVPARAEGRVDGLAIDGVAVLRAARHQNKLRVGHLKGNRFRIRIRDIASEGAARAAAEALSARGCPNYFGQQRFGRDGDNAALGRRLLLGERLPGRVGRFERRLYLSAYQSLLFNRALARRIEGGTFARALAGDVLRKAETGGLFLCTEPEVDQRRVDRFEVSPTGPLFGPKMPAPEGEEAALERALLDDEEVSLETFARGRGETQGGRRPFRLGLPELALAPEGRDLLVAFTLPKGSYATVVLDELMKPGG